MFKGISLRNDNIEWNKFLIVEYFFFIIFMQKVKFIWNGNIELEKII